MKVLHVVPSYIPAYDFGGSVKAVHDMAKALVRKGVDVSVFTTNIGLSHVPNLLSGSPKIIDGVKVSYYPVSFPRSYCYSKPLAAALEENIKKFDIVHIHSVYRYTTFAASRACVKYNKPYILNPFGALDPSMISLKSRIKKSVYIKLFDSFNIRNARAVHLASEYERERFVSLGFNVPTVVIRRGLDMQDYSRPSIPANIIGRFPQLKGKKVVLFLGRIHPKKGLELLASSFRKVAHARPDSILFIAGSGEERYTKSIKKLFFQMGLADKAIFAGTLLGAEKVSALYSSDIFVLPSYGENFGISVLEAMACGLPVIVTKDVGLSADISKYRSGIITGRAVDALTKSMLSLLQNERLRNEMGTNGEKLANEKFTLDAVADRMLEAYKSITDGYG